MVGTIDGKTREMVASLYGPEPVTDVAEMPDAPESVAPAEKRELSLDRPNVRAVVSMEVRMSGVDQCMRRLAYEAKEVEPSDEIKRWKPSSRIAPGRAAPALTASAAAAPSCTGWVQPPSLSSSQYSP